MANITCQSCGHENDTTRVFCQNCGIRLESPESASAGTSAEKTVPAQSAPKQQAAPVKSAKSSKKSDGGIVMGFISLIFTIIEVGILAAMTAALIQAWRAPNDVPPKVAPNKQITEKFTQVKSEAQSPYPRQVEIPQQDLNEYLATTIKLQSVGGYFSDYVKFDRLFLRYGTGSYDVVLEEKVYSHSFYLAVRYKVVTRKNGVAVIPVGAYLGRLPLYPAAAEYIARTFQPAWDVLGADLGILGSASQIMITPDKAVVNFPGSHSQ